MSKTKLIRTIYIYLFSLVGLVLVIISGVRFIDMGLKAWVFTEADSYVEYEYARPIAIDKEGMESKTEELTEEEKKANNDKRVSQQRQRTAASALAQLIIGLPLYMYHWKMASRRKEDE
jgi:hypothetical protein